MKTSPKEPRMTPQGRIINLIEVDNILDLPLISNQYVGMPDVADDTIVYHYTSPTEPRHHFYAVEIPNEPL